MGGCSSTPWDDAAVVMGNCYRSLGNEDNDEDGDDLADFFFDLCKDHRHDVFTATIENVGTGVERKQRTDTQTPSQWHRVQPQNKPRAYAMPDTHKKLYSSRSVRCRKRRSSRQQSGNNPYYKLDEHGDDDSCSDGENIPPIVSTTNATYEATPHSSQFSACDYRGQHERQIGSEDCQTGIGQEVSLESALSVVPASDILVAAQDLSSTNDRTDDVDGSNDFSRTTSTAQVPGFGGSWDSFGDNRPIENTANLTDATNDASRQDGDSQASSMDAIDEALAVMNNDLSEIPQFDPWSAIHRLSSSDGILHLDHINERSDTDTDLDAGTDLNMHDISDESVGHRDGNGRNHCSDDRTHGTNTESFDCYNEHDIASTITLHRTTSLSRSNDKHTTVDDETITTFASSTPSSPSSPLSPLSPSSPSLTKPPASPSDQHIYPSLSSSLSPGFVESNASTNCHDSENAGYSMSSISTMSLWSVHRRLDGIQEELDEEHSEDDDQGESTGLIDPDDDVDDDDDDRAFRPGRANLGCTPTMHAQSIICDDRIPPTGPILFDSLPSDSVLYKLASQFAAMINHDPWEYQQHPSPHHSARAAIEGQHATALTATSRRAQRGYSETAVYQFIVKYPDLCRIKYRLDDYFASPMLPLSVLCCLSTHSRSCRTVEACYRSYPPAMDECDQCVGTPLHYACSYQASTSVIKFLVRMKPPLTRAVNVFGRLPLHMQCMFPFTLNEPSSWSPTLLAKDDATSETARSVDLLLQCDPQSAGVSDNDGYLPLHLACENTADVQVVRSLLNVYPASITTKSKQGSTALHFACLHGASSVVIDSLLSIEVSAYSTEEMDEHSNVCKSDCFERAGATREAPVARYGASSSIPRDSGYFGYLDASIENATSKSMPASTTILGEKSRTAGPMLCRTMDSMGQLPLHMALMGGATSEVIRRLLEIYPAACGARTDRGETAIEMAHRLRPSASILDMLVNEQEECRSHDRFADSLLPRGGMRKLDAVHWIELQNSKSTID